MIEKIIERLASLGYEYVKDKDRNLLEQEEKLAEGYILSACNLSSVPDVLEGVYIDMVCGGFLEKRLFGKRTEESDDKRLERLAESVTEGDVTVKYESGRELSSEEKARRLIDILKSRKTELIANRRFKW